MITDTEPTAPQIEHLFVRGLRFEGELQYLSKSSGKRRASFREMKAPKAGRDGGLAWCSATAGNLLGTWPLAEHSQAHTGWDPAAPTLMKQLILDGGLAMIQIGDGYSNWWALVTGIEEDQASRRVTALLLLDVTQPLPWSSGYNARLAGFTNSSLAPLEWGTIDGTHAKVNILRWMGIHNRTPV